MPKDAREAPGKKNVEERPANIMVIGTVPPQGHSISCQSTALPAAARGAVISAFKPRGNRRLYQPDEIHGRWRRRYRNELIDKARQYREGNSDLRSIHSSSAAETSG